MLLNPILPKASDTSFGKRSFLNFSKTSKRFDCNMSHLKEDDKNECIINFFYDNLTYSSKCALVAKKITNMSLDFNKV